MATIFVESASNGGAELWVTDGTAVGTKPLKDIDPGSAGGDPTNFVSIGDKVVFVATDAQHGRQVWVTDGTAAGTTMLTDMPGGLGSTPADLILFDGRVYFQAGDAATGYSLWTTDGTGANTTRLLTLPAPLTAPPAVLGAKLLLGGNALAAGSSSLVATGAGSGGLVAGSSYYYATPTTIGVSDGTAAGTHLVWDGGARYYATFDATVGSSGIFSSYLGEPDELISTYGSTTDLGEFFTMDRGEPIADFTTIGGTLFFSGISGTQNLYATDGVNPAYLVRDINPGASSSPQDLSAFGGRLYFTAAADAAGDRHVWTSDGTAAGTEPITAGAEGLAPSHLVVCGRNLFFFATDAAGTLALYRSDGSAVGTSAIAGFAGATGLTDVGAAGASLYFTLTTTAGGPQLWTSDGTAAGTIPLETLPTGAAATSFTLAGSAAIALSGTALDIALPYEISAETIFTVTAAGADLRILDASTNDTLLATVNATGTYRNGVFLLADDGGSTLVRFTPSLDFTLNVGDTVTSNIPGAPTEAVVDRHNPDGTLNSEVTVSRLANGDRFYHFAGGSFFAGKSFAAFDNVATAQGVLERQTLFDTDGDPIAQTDYNADGSIFMSSTVTRAPSGYLDYHSTSGSFFTGKPFAGLDRMETATGTVASETQDNANGTVYQQITVTPDAVTGNRTYHFQGGTFFAGKPFGAYDNLATASDILLAQTIDNTDRSHAVAVPGSNVTLTAAGNDTFTVSGKNDTVRFAAPYFGKDVFTGYSVGDIFSFAGTVFTSFAAVQQHATGAVNAVITDASGDSLTISGVAAANLTAGMFKFL